MLTELSGGQILATCGGLTPAPQGGPERYCQMIHDKEAGIGVKVPVLMLKCLIRWLFSSVDYKKDARDQCRLLRSHSQHPPVNVAIVFLQKYFASCFENWHC
jgi:hypothetical protein